MKSNTEIKMASGVSPLGAWAFALGTSVGWGSLVVTSNTYLAQAGPWGSVLGLILGTVIMVVISKNYAYLIHSFPEPGGAYAYSRDVFGYDHGFLTGWFLALTYFAMLWANMTSIPLFARCFMGDVFQKGYLYSLFGYDVYFGEALLSIAALLLTVLLCSKAHRIAYRIMIALVCLFAVGITVVFAGSLGGLSGSFSPAFVPDASALSQIVKITVISPWAFIGFESISHSAEEFAFKKSQTFRVLLIAVLTTTALYVFVTLLSVTAYPPQYNSWLEYIHDRGSLSGLEALPAFYAADHYMGSFGVAVLMASLLALIITSLIGNLTAISRLFCALGRDKVLPGMFADLNHSFVPEKSIWLAAGFSVLIPFIGRTAIGWIVDVTTIGAAMIYGFVSAAAMKLARQRSDRTEHITGAIGLAVMIGFGLYIFLPNLVSTDSMEKETYLLFIVWSVLGFIFFRTILQRDREQRFGKSIVVWVALLSLVLFVALVWMRQSMISANQQMLSNIQTYYEQTSDGSALRLADEKFIEEQMAILDRADARTVLMTTGMFVFSLMIMMTNYSYMNRRNHESERIANTDPMTGVKSKYAYMRQEKDLDDAIRQERTKEFSVVVCDLNGLKQINDTYGHKAGDDYIRAASKMICEIFQHSPVFRIGGDEFVVLLTGHDYKERELLLEKLNQESEANIGNGKVVVAAGIADYLPGGDADAHSVFQRADRLMYSRKQQLKEIGAGR